jgi:Raf kinase inhibitor-like YbhB/YbcL family protein
MTLRLLGLLLACLALAGCGVPRTQPPPPSPTATAATPSFVLTSAAFKHSEAIPVKYTADGEGISPPLAWTGAPAGKREFALIMDDPDAPRETFVHWVIYGIPASASSLPENVPTAEIVPDSGAKQGKNSARTLGYTPPSPPPGKVHHYLFHLYALDTLLTLPPGATADALRKAMGGHVLATAELTGTYQRTR